MSARLAWAAAVAALWLAVLVGRLYVLQVERHEHYAEKAEQQQQRVVELTPPRGTIFDARGRELAVSIPADSLYADPHEVEDPRATARALVRLLPGLDAAELARELAGDGRFVWIARQLEPGTGQRIRALELPGIGLKEESRRYYPKRQLAAPLLGFVGTDGDGLAGLEERYDREVAGKAGRRVVLLDAGGRVVFDPQLAAADPEPGADLHLTLDATLQHTAERVLAETVRTFGARGATAVLLAPSTGAVLAMASYPSFDPNRFLAYPAARWRNPAVADAFEPGSTFKLATAAAALETAALGPDDLIDCEMGQIVLAGGVAIRDHRPFPTLTFRDVIAHSSNIGAIKIAYRVGDRRLYETARALGFGRRTGIDLPGESPGILRPLEKWQGVTKAYVAFGQGISVTALQLASAFAAVANGGLLLEPYVVEAVTRGGRTERRHPEPRVIGRALSAATARRLVGLLEAVVAEGGSGVRAAVPGYTVAGKTGTAEKPDRGGYSSHRRIASFVGFAPSRRPALVAAVVVDEPRTTIWGSQVAAPAFSAIVGPALLYLGVPPERPRPEAWPGERAPEAIAAAGVDDRRSAAPAAGSALAGGAGGGG